MRRRALRWAHKLVLSFVLVIALMSLANIVVTWIALKRLQEHSLRTTEVLFGRSIAERIYRQVVEQDVPGLTDRLLEEKRLREEKLEYLLIFDQKGYLLAHTYFDHMPKRLLSLPMRFAQGEDFRITQVDGPELSVYDVAVPVLEGIKPVGTVHLGIKGTYFKRGMVAASRLSAGLTGLWAIAGIFIALFIARKITRPVRQMMAVTEAFGKDRTEARSELATGDEFDRLADSFNRMLDRIKQNEAELKTAMEAAEAANRTKSAFLASMSHELRTPLNAIIGYGEMLLEETQEEGRDQMSADLEKILAASRHLLLLINDVLDLAKIEAGRMELHRETFDVQAVIQDVVSMIQPLVGKNHNVLQVSLDHPGQIHADMTRVRQIIFNLLSNSCKFTKDGTITLRATRKPIDGTEWLEVQVADSGIGMTPGQMSKLFQSFSQASAETTKKFGGTGLGLAICRKMCTLMGGEITVASESGKGSTFTVSLPANIGAKPAAAPAAKTAPAHGPDHGDRVLVIDDDPTVHDLMTRILNKEGYRTVCASNGEEGIRLARELHPAIITLDVMMPGMDGWKVLAVLKANRETADVPVIMISVLEQNSVGYLSGVCDYLTKPIDRERLIAIVGRYCGPGRAEPVLVVDDDAAVREMMARTLKAEGWSVRLAENGRRALESIQSVRPQMILLDLMMPEMDGFQFLEEFRKHKSFGSVPIIVVTAKDLTGEDRLRLNGYVSAVLEKTSCSADQLLAEIRNLKRLHPSSR